MSNNDSTSPPPSRKDNQSYYGGQIPVVWDSYYDSSMLTIYNHKLGGKHKKDLIGALAICGPSNLSTIARFVVERESKKMNKKLPKNYVYKKINSYFRIVEERQGQTSSLPGLVEKGYLFSTTENGTNIYFLTLEGCFVALGHKFDNSELKKFIDNAAKYHLFFAFLKLLISKGITFSFVKNIFIEPIQLGLIQKGKLIFDEDISFYFTNMAELCGKALFKEINKVNVHIGHYMRLDRLQHKIPLKFENHQRGKWISYILKLNIKLYKQKGGEDWGNETMKFFKVKIEDDKILQEGRLLWLIFREIDTVFAFA